MLRSNSKSLGNHVVCPEQEKKGYGGKNFQEKKLSLEWKSEVMNTQYMTQKRQARFRTSNGNGIGIRNYDGKGG